MVAHQLQVRCRRGKVRRSETDVLPLSYTTNTIIGASHESRGLLSSILHLWWLDRTTAKCHQSTSVHVILVAVHLLPFPTSVSSVVDHLTSCIIWPSIWSFLLRMTSITVSSRRTSCLISTFVLWSCRHSSLSEMSRSRSFNKPGHMYRIVSLNRVS